MQLYNRPPLCNSHYPMRNLTRFFSLLAAGVLTGCTGTLTNLAPTYQIRRADNLYPVAVAFESRQQSLRWETIKPFVVVDNTLYPMRPMPLMTNRWETIIPVAPNLKAIHFRYKFDWQYNAIPNRHNDTLVSAPQFLRIVDK